MGSIITNLSKEGLKNRLGLKPWKRFNDSSVVPDKGFRKQLKKLDETFEVIWDCIAESWEIWSFPKNGLDPYMVMTVGKPGTYEELSQQVLLQLQNTLFVSDNFTPKQVCDYLEEFETQMERKREESFRQKLKDIAIDTRAFANNVLQIQVPRSMKIRRAIEDAC